MSKSLALAAVAAIAGSVLVHAIQKSRTDDEKCDKNNFKSKLEPFGYESVLVCFFTSLVLWSCIDSALGKVLGESLSMMSLDLVAIVASYLRHGCLVSGATPRLLSEFRCNLGFIGQCTSIGCSPDGNIWIARNADFVQVFNGEGKQLFHLDRLFLHTPSSIVCHKNRVYVCNSGGRSIAVFDLNGSHVQTITGHGRVGQLLKKPRLVAVANSGLLFVVCRERRIEKFDFDGKFVRKWDSGANARLESIAVSPFGRIVTGHSHNDNNCLQIWNIHGKLLRYIQLQVPVPKNLAFDSDGNLVVCNPYGSNCAIYESDFQRIGTTCFRLVSPEEHRSEGFALERQQILNGACFAPDGTFCVLGESNRRTEHVFRFL